MNSFANSNSGVKSLIESCEDKADTIIRKSRKYLPHIARFCLISTFLEDGIRLITQFFDQIDYISSVWNAPFILSFLFILINIVIQLVGSSFILLRYQVKHGVGLLVVTVILQTIGYQIWRDTFLMRNLSLCGSLMLLLAETSSEQKSSLAGLPSAGNNTSKEYMLLGGRILVVLMFLTLIHFNGKPFYVAQSIANLILILLVAIGFKTKLCAVILVIWLTSMNFIYNAFWTAHYDASLWDFLKYDFFQTWSVIGGLTLIVAYGPGGVSVDDYKKKW